MATQDETAAGFDWGSLLGTGVNFLGDFFANNMRQDGLTDALTGLQNSPVLGELRGLRGLLGTQVGPQHEAIMGYDRGARSQQIKNDLFGMVRPELEAQAGQTISQDYNRGTLGLDLGGRGSPLQQAFSKNLSGAISQANVQGNQMALDEESQMRNWLLNDIQGIRQLAGEDLDLAKAFARSQEQGAQGNADLLSGAAGSIGGLLSSLFGGGGAASGALSSITSGLKSMFAGNSGALAGVDAFTDIFGDSAMEIVEALGGSAGDLLSSFGALPSGVFNMAPGSLSAADVSSLSNLFGSDIGTTFSNALGSVGGAGAGEVIPGLASILGGAVMPASGAGALGSLAGLEAFMAGGALPGAGAGAAAGGAAAGGAGLGGLAAGAGMAAAAIPFGMMFKGMFRDRSQEKEMQRIRSEVLKIPWIWDDVPIENRVAETKEWMDKQTPEVLNHPFTLEFTKGIEKYLPGGGSNNLNEFGGTNDVGSKAAIQKIMEAYSAAGGQ
jgi:hypothetical protein